jgi:hypothetical protein
MASPHTTDTPQGAAPNQPANPNANAPASRPAGTRQNMTRMHLSQSYTYGGQVYGPGDAEVPEGDASRDIQDKEDDYQRYLKEGGTPLPPVTPALTDAPHYDERLRRPGNKPPPRDELVRQGRGADVPAPQEQRDAAAKEAAERSDEDEKDRQRRAAGTAQETAGQRHTARESVAKK